MFEAVSYPTQPLKVIEQQFAHTYFITVHLWKLFNYISYILVYVNSTRNKVKKYLWEVMYSVNKGTSVARMASVISNLSSLTTCFQAETSLHSLRPLWTARERTLFGSFPFLRHCFLSQWQLAFVQTLNTVKDGLPISLVWSFSMWFLVCSLF